MKKIIVLAVSVLCGTLAFANGMDDPSKETSSAVVLSSTGSRLVKVYYKSLRTANVRLTIFNDRHQRIFSEMIKQESGFMRPYNFDKLPEGEYTIEIENGVSKQIEKVNTSLPKSVIMVHLAKVAGVEKKYALTGVSPRTEDLMVRIYDSVSQLVYEKSMKVSGAFGEVFNLKNISGDYTIEVSDDQGVIKRVRK